MRDALFRALARGNNSHATCITAHSGMQAAPAAALSAAVEKELRKK
jgi:hypothetical protein